MKKYVIMFIIVFLCCGCTNTKVEEDPKDIIDNPSGGEEEPIEEIDDQPPYSTLDEYTRLQYICNDFIVFDRSLFNEYALMGFFIDTDKRYGGKSLSFGLFDTDISFYTADYELIANDLFEGALYSFNGDLNDVVPDKYLKDVTFPLQNNDVDGYFVLSDDFKTLYFLTDEEQLTSGDYANAQICTIQNYR